VEKSVSSLETNFFVHYTMCKILHLFGCPWVLQPTASENKETLPLRPDLVVDPIISLLTFTIDSSNVKSLCFDICNNMIAYSKYRKTA